MDFIALDFETATHERHSACELGICVVENSEIKQTKTWLIKPPSFPYFSKHHISVHGIYPEDVANAPTFDEIWHEVDELLYHNLIIAHNASFDTGILRGCLDYYNLFKPKTHYLCSIQLSKKAWPGLKSYSLKNLGNHHLLQFNHHRAGDDASACAQLSLLAFERLFLTENKELEEAFSKNIKIL